MMVMVMAMFHAMVHHGVHGLRGGSGAGEGKSRDDEAGDNQGESFQIHRVFLLQCANRLGRLDGLCSLLRMATCTEQYCRYTLEPFVKKCIPLPT